MTIYGQSEELVSRCVECDLAEPESLASLGGSVRGLVDGILSCTEHQSHTYTIMTVTKSNVTISLTQPNDISLDCQVFKLPFWMAWQYYAS